MFGELTYKISVKERALLFNDTLFPFLFLLVACTIPFHISYYWEDLQ